MPPAEHEGHNAQFSGRSAGHRHRAAAHQHPVVKIALNAAGRSRWVLPGLRTGTVSVGRVIPVLVQLTPSGLFCHM